MYFLLHPIAFLNHLTARLMTDQITFVLSIGAFIFIALTYRGDFWKSFDRSIYQWAFYSEGGFLKSMSENFAVFGNAVVHIASSLLLAVIFLLVRHRFSIAIAILFVLIFSWGLNRALKLIYKRTRPDQTESITKRTSYCFPSGHVMASISIYFFNAMLLQGLLPFLPWYLIALVVSFFVIMSRIYLNHHYFTDVLAGIAMGIFCLNISIWFYFYVGLV